MEEMSKNRRILFSLMFLAAIYVLSLPARASYVVYESLETMARDSDFIAQVYVRAKTTSRDERGRAITLIEIEVVRSFKGAQTGEIRHIYQPGGSLEGECSAISIAPRFEIGEELVLFAHAFDGFLVTYAAGMGKFKVEREADKVSLIEDIRRDVIIIKPNGKANVSKRRFGSLEEFADSVRNWLKQPQNKGGNP